MTAAADILANRDKDDELLELFKKLSPAAAKTAGSPTRAASPAAATSSSSSSSSSSNSRTSSSIPATPEISAVASSLKKKNTIASFFKKLFGGGDKKKKAGSGGGGDGSTSSTNSNTRNDISKKMAEFAASIQSLLDSASSSSSRLTLDNLDLLINRIERLITKFGYDGQPLLAPLLQIYPKLLDRRWNLTGKAVCTHWKFLPPVEIITTDFSKTQEPTIKAAMRHPVDDRFDARELTVNGTKHPASSPSHPLYKFSSMKTHSLPPTELNCRLSATYPWVPVKKDDPDVIKFPPGSSNPYVKDGKVLINDPNNDGYLITVFPGLAVGAVVDGSGCGLRARLAANIVLAVLYEMIGGLVDIFKNSSPAPVASSDIYNWMQKVIVNAHRRIKKTTEAGSTTASFFILSKTSQTTKNSNNDVTSDGLNHKYTCFFAATGDVEAFFYSKKQNKWKYLFRDPSRFDALRIDPSHTPGGLGGAHGDSTKIHGMYLWQQSDWFIETAPKPDEKKSTRNNNLHFGQIFMDPDDFLLMSTDGLGDAIDPIRIFLEPSFAKKFAGLVNVPFINNNVAKTIPTVLTNWGVLATKLPLTSQETHALKQTIIDMVVQNHMLKNGEGKSSDLDAEIIAERCIEFAMYVTSGVREITGDSSNESTDKTELFEVAINKWLTENKAVMENKSTPLSFISPFAKPDHLGLVCAKVGIID